MKKISQLILLCGVFTFTACEKSLTVPDRSIPVVGITIDEPTHAIALDVAGSRTLQAAVTPEDATNKQVVWSSDDQTVATVSPEGVVRGVKAGTTKIRAVSAGDNSIADECLVTVAGLKIDVTQVRLNTDRLTVEIDQTKNLTVTVSPEEASERSVSWDSSDKTVATVSQTGSVTGIKLGTATITVTSDADPEKSANCLVTVTKKSIPATDMWMKTTKLELKAGVSKPLIATTIPTNATDQTMVWISDDHAVATVDAQGVVRGVKAGTTTVWAKWAPDPNVKDKCAVTVLGDSSYGVGDLYPDGANPIGVVFWKDPSDPAKGKILSLTEVRVEWSKELVSRGAADENDGARNLATIRAIPGWENLYPAFKWCFDRGSGWYLPAISEMKAIYDARQAVNAAIAKTAAEGAAALDDERDYWTSTERALTSESNAATIQFYKGFGGGGAPAGGTSFGSKDSENSTRAVLKF